ncbi:MAG: phosphatase PAP2 family protein [Ruminococcaceae bacterium]|nr:phosphatase PAP2 family protein [Oscillospiraceae bacterium]
MELLYLLEKIRIPILNEFMLLITHLGEETAFLAIGIIIFWCVDKYQGYYLMGVGLFGNMANQFLKITCRIPRPWVRDPDFHALEDAIPEATGYSFPSGHSQTAVGTFGCIAATQKNKIIRGICIAVMVLVPLSRMYVGVHTPADVLVGSVMALIMVFAFRPLMLGNGKKNIPWVFAALTALGIAYLLYVELYPFPADVDPHNYESAVKNGYTFLGCFVGLLIVWIVDEKKLHFTNEAIWWAQIIKAVLGLAVVLAVKEGTKGLLNGIFGDEMIARAVRYCLVVITAGIVWPLTFKWFAKFGKKES